ncbi:MAG: sugar transferase [Patescibacteria group bacterium]|nr:sugar transferase [Patescibacteria group bacterium]
MYYRIKQLTLLVGDWLMLYAGLYLGVWLRSWHPPTAAQWSNLFYPMTGLFALATVIFFIVGLYDLGQAKNSWRFFQKFFVAAPIWLAIGVVYFYINQGSTAQPKTVLLLCTVVGFGLVAGWRYLHNIFLSKTILKTNIVFAGLTAETMDIIKKLQKEPELGFETVGVIVRPGETAQEFLPGLAEYPLVEKYSDLLTAKPDLSVQLVVVAPSMAQDQGLMKELYTQLFRQTGVINLAKFYEEIMQRIPPFTFSESWFIANLQEQEKKIYDRFRILIDFIFASLMAIVFAVTYPLVALLIKISSPGPIFFAQERVGRNGQIFKIYKYRSMKAMTADGSAETNGPQYASIEDNRITALGKFMRKTRLDELPQFINIFKNEMSLVGPRPERPEFVAQLTAQMPYYALRHLIKPGLTGWAQIHKSYYGTIEENLRKLEYDLYYLKNRGILVDTAIILRTFNILGRMAGR